MFRCRLLLTLVAVLLMSANALAAYVIVPVENGSFEQPATGKIWGWDAENGQADVPGWHSDIAAFDSGVESDWPGCTDGDWSGFLLGGMSPWGSTYPEPSVWQILQVRRIEAGDQFKLAVDARDNWSEVTPAQLQMNLFYVAPGGARTVIASKIVPLDGSQGVQAVNLKDAANTSWRTYYLDTGELDVTPPVGYLLGIELANVAQDSRVPPGNTWIGIDNVRFVPEPATMLLLGLGSVLSMRRRK